MALLRDEAICIGQRKYSESSQIVTLFGREHGKFRAIAKGSRRDKSKFSGGIDLLTAGQVMFSPSSEGQSLAILTEFDLVEAWPLLRNRLIPLHCAQFLGAMIDDFIEEMDPYLRLYDAFKVTLARLQDTSQPEVALVGFEWRLFKEVGLNPIWHCCCACSRQLPPRQRVYFSASSGGILCPDCEAAVEEKRPVDPNMLELLMLPQNISAVNRQVVIEVHELFCYYYREIQGKQPQIMIFLNHLLQKGSPGHG